MTENDYSGYQEPVDEQSVEQLSVLVRALDEVEREIEEKEEELNKRRAYFNRLRENDIPELMESLGISQLKTTDGRILTVREVVRTNIPASKKAEAFSWLRENGYGAMIKRVVQAEFGMGEDEVADEFYHEIAQRFEATQDKTSVHPSTLASFVTSQLKEGANLPLELFNVHRQQIATIK